MKRLLAALLRDCTPLRALFGVAVRLAAPRHRVGVLAVIRDREGWVLIGHHTFRPWNPWGLLGGWIEPGEAPLAAIHRELAEELGAQAAIEVHGILLAAPHGDGGEPGGFSLIYECSLHGVLRRALPFELLALEWLPEETARRRLRPLEIAALDVAREQARRNAREAPPRGPAAPSA